MPFTDFYKTDLLGVPRETDQSLMNTVLANGARLHSNGFMQLADLAQAKKSRGEQLKKGQLERADKMSKSSAFFPENQKELGGVVQSSFQDVAEGRDISDKVNYANHVASMDQIHKNDFEQNEAAIREYDKNGVPQDLGAFEGGHAGNKIKIHHSNANELNATERADIDNGKYYQAELHPEKHHKSLEKTPFEDTVTKETPTGKTSYTISGETAFPINEPITLPDGTQGVKRRAPRNEQELIDNGYVDRFRATNPMVGHHWTQVASVSRQKQIIENVDARIKAGIASGLAPLDETGKPSEQFVKGAYEQAVVDETNKMIAKRLLDTDRGKLNIKTVNEVKAPKPAPKMNHDERENIYDVHNMGTDAKTYNTLSNTPTGIKNGRFLSHGGVVIKNKNGKKPTLTLNEQTVKNESTGEYEQLVEGSEATLDNIRFGYYEKGKEGSKKLHVPESARDLVSYIKTLTPQQVVDRDIQLEPTAYLTVHKSGGVGDTGLSPQEAAEYNTLKQKFSKKVPKEGSPDRAEYDHMRRLETVANQKEKTYSLPYKKVRGQLGQLIGDKNAEDGALLSRIDKKDQDQTREAQDILEQKRRDYSNGKSNTPKTPPVEKQKELRNKYNY